MNDGQRQRLKEIFAKTLGISDIPDDISQKSCTKWDSIAHLNLVIAIETKFGVMFEPEEIAAMRNFYAVAETLDAKLPV